MTKAIRDLSSLSAGTSVQSAHPAIRQLCAAPAVGYTHAIDAIRGCFAAVVERT